MQNINRVVVTGNLVRDPEMRQAGETSICSLRIAVNGRRKVGGEWTDVPGFFDVTVFGKQGESVGRYMAKGKPIAVDGRLDFREWEDKEGQKRSAVGIVAESVQFLGDGKHDGAKPAAAAEPDFPVREADPIQAQKPDTDPIPF